MEQIVIYKREDNGICFLSPVLSSGLTIEEIAKKDVPEGVPYKIVDRASLDQYDSDFSDAWETDFTNADGVGMGHKKWYASKNIKI